MSNQCTVASKKVNMMKSNFKFFFITLSEVMKRLYTAFVRPHLEYAIQF